MAKSKESGFTTYHPSSMQKDNTPLSSYAVASLNKGSAHGTTPEKAIERFREQLMSKKVEYSAFLDDQGYFHSLGSTGRQGSTKVAPFSSVAKEKGVSTVVHNHPYGTSDGRKWGGPLSTADLSYIANAHSATGGKINRIVATAREGTYSANVTRKVSSGDVNRAAKRADKQLDGKKFRSEKAMWRAVHSTYKKEFAKIGIDLDFSAKRKKKGKLVTQKTGTY